MNIIIGAKPPLLEFVGTIIVPKTTCKFSVKNKIVSINHEQYMVDENFIRYFLWENNGKIEYPIAEHPLGYADLSRSSLDNFIIDEIGGEAKVETTLTGMFLLLDRQNDCRDDVLRNDNNNIFFIKDQYGSVMCTHIWRFLLKWRNEHTYG